MNLLTLAFAGYGTSTGLAMFMGTAWYNPWFAVGQNLMATLFLDVPDNRSWGTIWIYIVGPIIGAFLAAILYRTVFYNTAKQVLYKDEFVMS